MDTTKITIFAAGSRGDIQPCLALAKGLQAAGYRVSLAAPMDFADFAEAHHIDFSPLRGDVQKIMASDTGKTFMETGGSNPFKAIRAMRTMIAPVIRSMTDDAYEACKGADALICLGVFFPFGQSIAEALGIPIINIEPTPLLPTKAFPAPSWPIQKDLGGLHNFVSGILMLSAIWLWYRPFVKDLRRRLGLSPVSAAGFYRLFRATPMIGAYSPHIIGHPGDWPSNFHIVGYLFLDSATDWLPSPELDAFLKAGSPPVYVGFGSMSGKNPEFLAELVIEALRLNGQRGVLSTGWGGLKMASVPQNIFVVGSAPHSGLFPRMAAVAHHGGAGTLAESLRAGVPTVVVPFLFDQPFWGARIRALGLGPAPVPQKNLSAERLARALKSAVEDPSINRAAAAMGAAIRAERGAERAVRLISAYLAEMTTDKKGGHS